MDSSSLNFFENKQYFFHKDHLGSSIQISDISANIIHHIEYMPYGEAFVEQRSNWGMNYKFNGKELDEETGYYYYGARYYTPDLSIWLSVDPLSDKYPHQSNYMYCSGRPIIMIDPDGRDEFNVCSQTGKTTWVGKSVKHLLFATDSKGNRTGNFVEVKNIDVLNQLANKDANGNSVSKDHTTGSIDDVFKVFKFCSDNTNVEWGLARYEDNNTEKYSVYTSHSKRSIKAAHQIGLGRVISSIHSHQGVVNNYYDEMESMGAVYYDGSGYKGWMIEGGDWGNKRHDDKRNYPMYVYFPNSKNIYSVNKDKKPSLIDKIDSYKGFYFGVLNHK